MPKNISRREFLRIGGLSLVAMWMGGALAQNRKNPIVTGGEPAGGTGAAGASGATGAVGASAAAKDAANAAADKARFTCAPPTKVAKSVINIYLDGGPSHIDMFDPKPDAGRDYFGNYRSFQKTNTGEMIGEKLPRLAKIADKYSIIRSMTHTSNAHETAHYYMTTGDMTRGDLVYPSYGSAIALLKEKEYKGTLPIFITLTEASTRFSESGFLGPRYKSFETGGNPQGTFFDVEGIVNHNVPDAQLQRRKELLYNLEGASADIDPASPLLSQLKDYQERTYSLILGDARKAFDLTQEPKSVREKYDRDSKFGQSCLAARRLVERGVDFVTVRFTGWDTHKQHFARMDERLAETDAGLASLLEDLDRLGLLDQTMVICGGEFGRTPRIMWEPPWNGGRGHYAKAFSYVVAGGGFKGGEILGRTDKTAENVIERPVWPPDLIASIYHLLGIDPLNTTLPYLDSTRPLLPSYGDPRTSNGLLKELFKV